MLFKLVAGRLGDSPVGNTDRTFWQRALNIWASPGKYNEFHRKSLLQ